MKDSQDSLLIWVLNDTTGKKCKFNNKPSFRRKRNSVFAKAHNSKSQQKIKNKSKARFIIKLAFFPSLVFANLN